MSSPLSSSENNNSQHLKQDCSPKFHCKPALFESKSQVMGNWIVFHRNLSDAGKILIFALNGIFTCTHTWVPVQSDLQKRLGWGKEKMRKTIKECQNAGFLRVTQRRHKSGEFACHDFEFCIDASFKEKNIDPPQGKPAHNEYEPETGFREPDDRPLPSSKEDTLLLEHIVCADEPLEEKSSKKSTPSANAVSQEKHDPLEEHKKITITDFKNQKVHLSLSDVFTAAIQKRKDWSTEEIREAFIILKKYKSPIRNWVEFIDGTIKNNRKLSGLKSLKLKTQKKEKGVDPEDLESGITPPFSRRNAQKQKKEDEENAKT